jgi:general secretion pathway protein G
MAEKRADQGYTLIELVLVLVIIGIITTIGLKSLTAVNQTARIETTRGRLDRLAVAMVGNPSLVTAGSRTDFGYVGDIGALPPSLDALVTNPGGYTTWNGPYLGDDFSTDGSSANFKTDAWGKPLAYSGGVTISSTGGPSALTRELAGSIDDLLYSTISAVVTDLDRTPPGTIYRDSVRFLLTFPYGTGGLATVTRNPRPDGYVRFDSIPIGLHLLRVIYAPASDTLRQKVVVHPGVAAYLEISWGQDIWSGS